MAILERRIKNRLEQALGRSPVVLLTGARQTGKTTLIKAVCGGKGFSYITFDDPQFLAAAKGNPIGFIAGLSKPVVLDEVQRVPELFLPIKQFVDEHRTPGLFALTGSANPMLIPRLGDSLVGRMEILELYPFSQSELHQHKETFLASLFTGATPQLSSKPLPRVKLAAMLCSGGYPSVCNVAPTDAAAWFGSYLNAILQRDVRDLANIEGLLELPNLLQLIAARVGALLNGAELSRESRIAPMTLHRYLALLNTLFLITMVRPWSSNFGKRLVKAPKTYLIDTGLLTYLLRINDVRLSTDTNLFGKVFENFVVSELLKQASWTPERVDVYHYRTSDGIEIDCLLENGAGSIVGVEVKGSETVISDDFKGLRQLRQTVGSRFVSGVVVYTGNVAVPFDYNLWAIPISALWT